MINWKNRYRLASDEDFFSGLNDLSGLEAPSISTNEKIAHEKLFDIVDRHLNNIGHSISDGMNSLIDKFREQFPNIREENLQLGNFGDTTEEIRSKAHLITHLSDAINAARDLALQHHISGVMRKHNFDTNALIQHFEEMGEDEIPEPLLHALSHAKANLEAGIQPDPPELQNITQGRAIHSLWHSLRGFLLPECHKSILNSQGISKCNVNESKVFLPKFIDCPVCEHWGDDQEEMDKIARGMAI